MDLEEAKRKWWCNSFPDLQEEAKLRSWNEATTNKWLLAAKCLSITGLNAHWFSETVEQNTVSAAKRKSALACSNQHAMTFERHDYRDGSYECNDCKQAFQNDKHWLCILCSEDLCLQCANASALSESEDNASRTTLLSWAKFTRQHLDWCSNTCCAWDANRRIGEQRIGTSRKKPGISSGQVPAHYRVRCRYL